MFCPSLRGQSLLHSLNVADTRSLITSAECFPIVHELLTMDDVASLNGLRVYCIDPLPNVFNGAELISILGIDLLLL